MDWQKKVSISTHASSDQPLREVVHRLIEEDWRGIEIMAEGLHKDLLSWSQEELEELKSLGLRHQITVVDPCPHCRL